jgi:hypothetical protein
LASTLVSWTDADRGRRASHRDAKVIVIALDGVRWQEVFEGCAAELTRSGRCPQGTLTPNLERLFSYEGAALGAPGRSEFGVEGPSYLSMPGYQQMFTGVRRVACESNDCGRVRYETITDAVAKRFGPGQAVVFSSWAGVGEAATRDPMTLHISAGAEGTGASGYRRDAETARLAIEFAERALPRFLFVGLGDTDEEAHTGNYDAYLAALTEADAWIGRFADLARRQNEQGRETTLIVTTDHGRALDAKEHERVPEAARTWLVASGPKIRARGMLSGGSRQLSDVAPTVADLLDVALPGADGRVLEELFATKPKKPFRVALSFGRPR